MQPVDLIIHNAKIYTVDEDFSTTESLVVKNGKFVATGESDHMLKKYSALKTIDLQGNYVYPGFIDPHCHFYDYGTGLTNADLTKTSSFEEVIDIIKSYHKESESRWITGYGWDQNKWEEKRFPHRYELDKVFPKTPVVLTRICTHGTIANTEALLRAGIDPEKPGSLSDQFIRKDGKLTGMIIGRANTIVKKHIPGPSEKEKEEGLLKAQEHCFAYGLTSVNDAGLDRQVIRLLDSCQKKGRLKMRVYAMLKPTTENFETFLYKGIYKTSHLHIRSIKLFADGALGPRSALLIQPYSDDPGNSGVYAEKPENLRKLSQKAFENGYQVNTHCIGDLAVRLVLNIYGDILKEANERRWRAEHAQIVHPADTGLFGKYSIIPSVQASQATSDMSWAHKRIGRERLKNSYRYRDLMEQNGWIANGSDFPVESLNPLKGFYAAVARKNDDGHPGGGFQPENALTRRQALQAMTIWAAKASFEENEKGSIEPGKIADFTVTGEDIMKKEIEKVPRIKVLKTFSGGVSVYSIH